MSSRNLTIANTRKFGNSHATAVKCVVIFCLYFISIYTLSSVFARKISPQSNSLRQRQH